VRELAISKAIAGMNMRLNAGGIRELHWHKEAEWAYMLYGSARIAAIDAQGRNLVDDVLLQLAGSCGNSLRHHALSVFSSASISRF
jgi:oxalate decarboxylase/phosphoglucose isomerase-like protein (cupin superfamily)